VEPGNTSAVVPLPRFPGAAERDALLTATVPDGLEVRGETRDWDGEYAAWGSPLAPAPGPDGKAARVVTSVNGKSEGGFSRVTRAGTPHHPELAADIRADVTVGDRQVVVLQQVKLRSAEGLPRPLRFRASPPEASPAALRTVPPQPPLEPAGPGEWTFLPAP